MQNYLSQLLSSYLKKPLKILLVSLLFSQFSFAETVGQSDGYTGPLPVLGEPEYNLTDRNNVNTASGAMYYKIPDVAIGSGALSLNHTITVTSNDITNANGHYKGYKDKYSGGLLRVREQIPIHGSRDFYFWEYISVFDHEASYRFEIKNGQFVNVSDKTVTLAVNDNRTFVLTKTDGTRVYYYAREVIPASISDNYSPWGVMNSIEYTNGFVITIHRETLGAFTSIKSVTTNNGLQLKYVYENKPGFWASSGHPLKIIALNNAVETCPLLSNTCTLQKTWPTVNYSWPSGMPAAMSRGTSQFVVTASDGTITTFHNKAIDLCPANNSGCQTGRWLYPHTVRVTNNKGLNISYAFSSGYPGNYHDFKALSKACQNGVCEGYSIGANEQITRRGSGLEPIYKYAGSPQVYKGMNWLYSSWEDLGHYESYIPYYIDMWDKEIHLNKDPANKVSHIKSKLDGTTTYYEYDGKGRLLSSNKYGIYKANVYFSSCSNYKYCNKPEATTNYYSFWDGETPSMTYYDYHAQSGQVKRIRKQVRSGRYNSTIFTYQKKYARYINQSGNMVTSDEPIWLLSSQFSCKSGSVNSSQTGCSSNDKITTTYEYGSGSAGNNLFLIGKTMTTQGENAVYRTCYKYDRFGNKIGETQPKAQVADCNIGREY